jgi:hypothetical protein
MMNSRAGFRSGRKTALPARSKDPSHPAQLTLQNRERFRMLHSTDRRFHRQNNIVTLFKKQPRMNAEKRESEEIPNLHPRKLALIRGSAGV